VRRLKTIRGESDEFERLLRKYLETHPAEDDRIKKLQVRAMACTQISCFYYNVPVCAAATLARSRYV
jgi:predicted Zn-dependent protease